MTKIQKANLQWLRNHMAEIAEVNINQGSWSLCAVGRFWDEAPLCIQGKWELQGRIAFGVKHFGLNEQQVSDLAYGFSLPVNHRLQNITKAQLLFYLDDLIASGKASWADAVRRHPGSQHRTSW